MTMENRLESKCDSLRLYLLDHLDRLLPPETPQAQVIRNGPAKATPAGMMAALGNDRWEVGPIPHRVTEALNCTLPISQKNCGLDREGWLFVSDPS